MITECNHGMPTPKACVECMADGPVTDPSKDRFDEVIGGPIDAERPQRCRACPDRIVEGDTIVEVEGRGWIHVGCIR